ncbi:MAG: hypothetical protein Kow00122_10460 [Thermoleophilia bacterium]
MHEPWRSPSGLRRRLATGTLAVAMAVAVTAAGTLAGCSNKTETSSTATTAGGTTGTSAITELTPPSSINTTSTAAGQQPATTTTSVLKRIDVSGKSSEEYAKQLPDLEKKAKDNPNDLAVLQELAIAQYQTQHYAEAAATYQQMLKIKDDPTTHNNYANVLRDWGKKTEAVQQYEKALSGNPKLVVAYVNLASLYLTENNRSKAYEVLDRGIANTSGEDQQRLKDIKTQMQAQQTTTTTKG